MSGELARDVGLSAGSKISRVMKCALVGLQQEICTRFRRSSDVNFKQNCKEVEDPCVQVQVSRKSFPVAEHVHVLKSTICMLRKI